MDEYHRYKGFYSSVLVVLITRQVIFNLFMKQCTLTITSVGNGDLLIHCLKPNQPCPAGVDQHYDITKFNIEQGSWYP